MHKLILVAVLLATPASAQVDEGNFGSMVTIPKTVTLKNNATGETIGTATLHGNRAYIRDAKGELLGTMVMEANGTQTYYDPHGKLVPPEEIGEVFRFIVPQ